MQTKVLKNVVLSSIFILSIFSLTFLDTGVYALEKENKNDSLEQQNKTFNKKIEDKNPALTVGTYNVASGLHDHKINPNKVGEAIKSLKADFIGLQEVDKNTKRNNNYDVIKMISKSSGMKYYDFNPGYNVDGGTFGTAVLSKYPIQKYKIYKATKNWQFTIAEVKIPKFERPIYFVNVHMDWKVSGGNRPEQVNKLNEILNDDNTEVRHDFPDIIGGVVVLTGDFNASSQDKSLENINTRWKLMKSDKIKDYRTWPAANPGVDYDHIYTSKSQKWTVENIFLPTKKGSKDSIDWATVSDHLPVVERLRLDEY